MASCSVPPGEGGDGYEKFWLRPDSPTASSASWHERGLLARYRRLYAASSSELERLDVDLHNETSKIPCVNGLQAY